MNDLEVREKAATDLASSFVIEAGAGTGKTRLIVDRLLTLVLEGFPLERIVAITFTEKAAAEMKLRLRDRLETARASERHAQRLARIEEASRMLETAPIGTIHSFCSSILGQYPVEAGIDPAFEVADEVDAQALWDGTFRGTLHEVLGAAPPAIDRALGLGLEALHVGPLLDGLARDLKGCRGTLPMALPEEVPQSVLRAREHIEDAAALARSACTRSDDLLAQQIRMLAADLASMAALEGEVRGRVLLQMRPARTSVGRAEAWGSKHALEQARAKLADANRELAQAAAAIRHNVARGWLEIGLHFVTRYEAAKRSRSLVDFDDLLVYTRDLLVSRSDVRQQLAGEFDAIVLDEFQDTDPVQAEIARLLGGPGGEIAPGRVFVVGDPKQSIYAFRGADIEAYVEFREALRRSGGHVESITCSFRPVHDLLTFANEVSGRLFPREATRFQPTYEPLTGGDQPAGSRPALVVLASSLQAAERDDEPGGSDQEAAAVAGLLREALEDRWPVRDRASGPRPIRPGDIAILLPAMTAPLDKYEKALQAADVPYVVAGGKRLYRRVEIMALLAAMAAIDDPTNRLALVAALRSPLFGISDDALVLRAAGPYGLSLFDVRGDDIVAPALSLLRELHDQRNRSSPSRVLESMLDRTGALGAFMLKRSGVQRVHNVLKLVDEARRLAGDGRLSFKGLARLLSERLEQEHADADSPAAESGEEAVEILTVHKSKGLEFSMVVLGALSHKPQADQMHASANAGALEGLVKSRGGFECETAGWQSAKKARTELLMAERRRLQYVALTRARDYLVLPIYPKGDKLSGPLSLLAGVVPEIDELLAGGAPARFGSVSIDLRRIAPVRGAGGPASWFSADQVLEALTDPLPADDWREHRAALLAVAAQAPVRYAPSRLATSEPELPHRSTAPGGAELGTAVHRALELADLADPRAASELAGWLGRRAGLPADAVLRARELTTRALCSPLVERARAARRMWRELPVCLPVAGGLVEGSIDLCFEEEGVLVIVDYKTDAIEPSAMASLFEHHRPQLALYAHVLARVTGQPVREAHALYLSAGESCRLDVTDAVLSDAAVLLGRKA